MLCASVPDAARAHVSIYVGPLEAGDDPRCIVEADISAGVRAVPLSEFKGQRARIIRPLGLNEADRQRLAEWLVGHIGAPYDLAHAWALGRSFLKLPAPRTIVQDAKRFICSSLSSSIRWRSAVMAKLLIGIE